MITPYKDLLKFVVITALVAASFYTFHRFCESLREQGRVEARAEYEKMEQVRKDTKHETEALWKDRVLAAEHKSTERENTVRSLVSAGNVSADRLQRILDTYSNGASTATEDALRASTVALSAVFSDCQSRYRALGKAADGHAGDVQTLMEAWPTAQVPIKQP